METSLGLARMIACFAYREEKEKERVAVEHIGLLLGEMGDVEQGADNETQNNQ